MGMTIEEAIKYYENKNVVLTEEEALANTLALNTMRKYQKIEQILKDIPYGGEVTVRKIQEVVDDGDEYKLSELKDKCIKYIKDGCCKYTDCRECDYQNICEEREVEDGNDD